MELFIHSGIKDLNKLRKTKTAFVLYSDDLISGCILSYNKQLDKIIINQILPGTITEFAGLPGSGKTQLCFQLSVTAQLPKSLGGLEGQVLYINTNRNFATHAIEEYVKNIQKITAAVKHENVNFTEEKVLKNIYSLKIEKHDELMEFLKYLPHFLQDKNVNLVIIDSIAYLLRKIDKNSRNSIVYSLLQSLQDLAVTYKFAIVLTNDMTTRVENTNIYETPAFGLSFFHRVNTRIVLENKNQNHFSAKVEKSVFKTSNTEVYFKLLN